MELAYFFSFILLGSPENLGTHVYNKHRNTLKDAEKKVEPLVS
jgi:hypothetical protein